MLAVRVPRSRRVAGFDVLGIVKRRYHYHNTPTSVVKPRGSLFAASHWKGPGRTCIPPKARFEGNAGRHLQPQVSFAAKARREGTRFGAGFLKLRLSLRQFAA